MSLIYIDYNASAPITPEVAEAMRPLLKTAWGNPSSHHWAGRAARSALAAGRNQVARALGCEDDEIVFTSGGSESNNLAITGTFFALRTKGKHVISQVTEHPSVLNTLAFIERLGAEVTYLGVDSQGRISAKELQSKLRPDTILVSLMHANNETGTIQPIQEASSTVRERGIVFHCDAAQSVGKIATQVGELGVDLLTVAGHKLGAPKGVGALYVRRNTRLEPLIHGAGHESGRRAGTESALLAVGLGQACTLASDLKPMIGVGQLRDRFQIELKKMFGSSVVVLGNQEHRLPNTLNIAFVEKQGAEVLAKLDGVAASTGSACHEGMVTLSPVLKAMGVPPEIGLGAIRFSLGRATSWDELARVLDKLQVLDES